MTTSGGRKMRRSSTQEPLRVLPNGNNKQQYSSTKGQKSTSSTYGRSSSGNRLSFGRSTSSSRASNSGIPMPGTKRRSSSSGPRQSVSTMGNRKSLNQPRQSVFGLSNMPKTSRLSRGSGIGMRGGGSVAKDPRPISDKGFQHKCMKQILQFLTDRGYPHNVTPRVLQSPPMKDFIKIFEFIYSFADPQFKLGPKPEDEVPRILKLIGYPFLISKTSMFAIGSPHTWPHMLAALTWMVDLITYGISTNEEIEKFLYPPDDEEDFESLSEAQIFADYTERCYQMYMEGHDTFEENDALLLAMAKSKFLGSAGGLEGLMQENTALEEQLEMLEKNGDQVKTLESQLNLKANDEQIFVKYLQDLETHLRQSEKELTETEDAYSHAVTELEAEKARMLKLQKIFDAQEFTPEDVEKIKLKQKDLKLQVENVEKSCQSVDQEIWTEEMGLAKDIEQMGIKCEKYNNTARQLKLIPITAENSSNIDYEMKANFLGSVGSEFSDIIKPALMTLKSQCVKSVSQKEYEVINRREQLEQALEYVSEIEDEIGQLECKYKRTDEEVECNRLMQQADLQKLETEIDELQSEYIRIQNAPKLTEEELQKEKNNVDKWFERELSQIKRKLKEYSDFLKTVFTEVIQHFETTEGQIRETVEFGERMLTRVQKASAPDSNH